MWQATSARIVLLVALAAVAYFAFAAVSNGVQTHRLRQDEEQMSKEIGQLQEEYSSLVGLHEYVRSDEYVESVARQQLGLVRPGETPIVVLPTADEGKEEEAAPVGRWWDVFLGR